MAGKRAGDERGQNRGETIFRDLRRRILSGELAAGQRLVAERELAVTYATNRNTLREAIRKLEQARLVTVRHGQGISVADFRQTGTLDLLAPFLEHSRSLTERVGVLLDLLEARVRMLELAVARVAERATPADVARLSRLAAEQMVLYDRGARAAIARGDFAWIDALIDAAHSIPVRWSANTFLEVYRGLLDRFPSFWILDEAYPRYLGALIGAVSAGESARAVEVIRTFFERTDATLVSMLERLLGPEDATGDARVAATPERSFPPIDRTRSR